MNKRKVRVCLIVDNPLRDLEGMVLLAHELALRGFDVYLTPMYHQEWDIFRIRPQVVLMNYLRENNKRIVKSFSDAGIAVGVLDTEGGIFGEMEEEFTFLVKRNEPGNVDFYCFWGEKQQESFLKNDVMPKEKMFVTGCPRYDFCGGKWRGALQQHHSREAKVLIATRFSMIFPRFNKDFIKEISTMENVGYKIEALTKLARENFFVWAEMVKLTGFLADEFKDRCIFIIRPHPFERKDVYESLFRDKENVQVVQEGTSLEWLNSCDLLIQKDCSTAVEAFLLNKPSVSIDWVDTEMLSNKLLKAVSIESFSKEEVFSIVEDIVSKRFNSSLSGKDGDATDYFFKIDGKASERVADVIEKYAQVQKRKKNKFDIKKISALVKSGLIKIMGLKAFFKIKSILTNRPIGIAKFYTVKDIKDILKRINKVNGKSGFTITDSSFYFSIKVTKD